MNNNCICPTLPYQYQLSWLLGKTCLWNYYYYYVIIMRSETIWEWRPQKSAGGWRKDEVVWMSLALVGDRNGIRPQNLCTNYSSWNVLSLHSSSFTAVPSPVWKRHDRMMLKRITETTQGDQLTKFNLEGWPLSRIQTGKFLAQVFLHQKTGARKLAQVIHSHYASFLFKKLVIQCKQTQQCRLQTKMTIWLHTISCKYRINVSIHVSHTD